MARRSRVLVRSTTTALTIISVGAMTDRTWGWLSGFLAIALLLTACDSADPPVEPSTTTAATTTPVAPSVEELRAVGAREELLEGLVIEVVGDTVELRTGLFRGQESAPSAAGLCLSALDAGAEGMVEVYGSDGGLMASTSPEGMCRLVPSLRSES